VVTRNGLWWWHCGGWRAAAQAAVDASHLPLAAGACLFTVQVMTHANMLQEDRLKVGITDGFVRISCGIEDSDDLIASMKQSLDAL